MKTLLVSLALLIAGCGTISYIETHPDGTRIEVSGGHVFTDPTITGARFSTTQKTIQVDGFKSQTQAQQLTELLKAIQGFVPVVP